jgi:hypothetical protein
VALERIKRVAGTHSILGNKHGVHSGKNVATARPTHVPRPSWPLVAFLFAAAATNRQGAFSVSILWSLEKGLLGVFFIYTHAYINY